MKIDRIRLSKFRNHENIEIENNSFHLWIVGNNGAGKTNILEAIYWTLTGKVLRASSVDAYIPWGDEARISGVLLTIGSDHLKSTLVYDDGLGKSVKHLLNDKPKRPSDLTSLYPCIYFCPEDIEVLARGTSDKRNYLDDLFSIFDKEYKKMLSNFNNLLKRRNILLKDEKLDKSYFLVWDEQIYEAIINLNLKRYELIALINERLNSKLPPTMQSKYQLEIRYTPSFEGSLEYWESRFEKDRLATNTTRGSHRDVYEVITKTGVNISDFASRGEHRLIHLAVLLSGMDLIKSRFDYEPVLLIDDVFSELDQKYSHEVVEMLEEYNLIGTSIDKIEDKVGRCVEL